MKFTLSELIEEAKIEKLRREQTYPHVFGPSEQWAATKAKHIAMQGQIVEVLEFLHANEAAFKALLRKA
jgi:hypothetical protein